MALITHDLKDEEIITCLQTAYGLEVKALFFLPIGADLNTAVYHVTACNGEGYFLKLRRGKFFEASVSVPKYLTDLGIKQIIPPIATKMEKLWVNLGSFNVTLYPYMEGCNGVNYKLSEQQWVQFGSTIKKLHSTDIPIAVTKNVPRETFSSKWCEIVKEFLMRIENEVFKEPVDVRTATFLKSKSAEVLKIIERTQNLALILEKKTLEYVLCHADIHGWNLLVDKEDSFYLVDWDTLIFAPKERDLMFVSAGIWDSSLAPTEERALFYKGYGQTEINRDAICYYRFERIIQDIGEYCEHIFLSDESNSNLQQSFEYLQSNFCTNGTIERAFQYEKSRQ